MLNLEITKATDREIIKHYAMMLDYWIAESEWQERRAGLLDAEFKKECERSERIGRAAASATAKAWEAERTQLEGHVAELEKERDNLRAVAREAHAQLQRAARGSLKLNNALGRILDVRPLGAETYPECYNMMRAIALAAISDDGPPGPKHPPRVPGHNPVG